MPELPEVETICRGIEQNIIGKKIAAIQTSDKNLRLPFPKNFSELKDQKIISVARRARYILIKITTQKILLVHLGMSGKLLYLEKLPKKLEKHDHFVMQFSDDSCLIYNDPRRFGLVDLVDEKKINLHSMIKNLGFEPLTKDFNGKYLQAKLKGKKINIKTVMMDNAIVVGVGNIYINESLFESKISPLREAGNLSLKELETLINNIKKILQKAIKLGGSTLRDYVKSNGDVGGFQFDFKVYGRDNCSCLVCSGKIKKIKQNGRSSFYCPSCQH
ncbi:MAG: bifunctional DNA-formamidopyrimidine glycosylase/DNA-(apurinic or apyrimidinic site) lyase [Pseudomonadota bacterium]